jgi:hypothetical protein
LKTIANSSFYKISTFFNPGPKPDKSDGTPDRRRRVTQETKPKHPELKPHKHKPGDSK